MRIWRPRALRHWVLAVLCFPVLAGARTIGDEFVEDDNFRVVDAAVFRSGQLREDEWNESLAEHGYRSVLNLRGAEPTQPWYALELRFAAEHHLAHFDIRLSAEHQPSAEALRQLLTVLREAPKPLLVHCKNGADRSGLAAALYLFAIRMRPAAEAEGQLSLRFGHFPWLVSQTGAMDRALSTVIDASHNAGAVPSG